MIAAGNNRLFRSLVDVVGLPELAADPRFASNALRAEHRAELTPPIAERLAAETSAHWLERLREAGVPVTAVRDVVDVARDEQTAALGILQQLGEHLTVGPPLSFDGERPRYRSAPPRAGEHSAEILAEAGFSEAEIAELTS